MPTLAENIRAARKEKRLSLQDLATQLGVTVAAVSQWETGASAPSMKNRAKLSALLQLPASEMLEVYTEVPTLIPQKLAGGITPIDFEGDPIPIWWHREEDGVLHIERRPVGMIPRTHYLRYSKYAFGIECHGDIMAPVFERRDVAIINPDRPVAPGDDVVLVRNYEPDSNGAFEGVLRRLLADAGTHWLVRQYNPQKDYKLTKADWPRALHVAGKQSR